MECMEFNTAKYLHALYQVMNMTFADRDFYYGDPYYEPAEPMKGLLSKEYAKKRVEQINWEKNVKDIQPGNPYPFQGFQQMKIFIWVLRLYKRPIKMDGWSP